jgi:hypothetical protein
MCRCRTSLIGGTKKGHGKISWPNPIEVLQQNPSNTGLEYCQPRRLFRAMNGLLQRRRTESLFAMDRPEVRHRPAG